jgi:hypothetical protein
MSKEFFSSEEEALNHYGDDAFRDDDGDIVIEPGGCYGVLRRNERTERYYVDWAIY